MLKVLAWMDRGVGEVLKPVVFAGMIGLTGVITLQIVSRVFFTSVGWTEEVARFLLIWITFLGAALAFQQGRHIAVTLLRDSLPLTLRRIVSGAGIVVTFTFLVTLAVIGWRYMNMQSYQKSPSLRLSMTYVYAVMPLASAIMAGLSLIDLIRLLAGQAPRETQTELNE
ncbi:TRAP-type C4-dicarboxylate transport system, small permease component [Celeribacter baekdonensis]|jgi:TRAP-type C4-dicarboxylate transport system permease small subunit|uniref:TRAP transporter small permease protein n=1 Tax=Celeribacter baekdonensis TaxID=875171 RepID=A0A1G7RZ43_9RHOB|nr:TRAP transporter small permease [Celeribacter baekdonensis]SDG15954.1 TRAP-type C4-dicarboxylate transport system, small permease component [Celeribacter baekdonensis]